MKAVSAASAVLKAYSPVHTLRASRTCPKCSPRTSQRRDLSHTASRRGVMGQVQLNKNSVAALTQGGMKSHKSAIKNATRGQIPTDIGLLPTSIILPSIKELFQMYKGDKRMLLKVLWLRVKRPVQSLTTLFYLLKWRTRRDRLTGKKQKSPPFELSQRVEIARRLHQELYYAIASRDKAKLKEIACAGLLAQSYKGIDRLKEKGTKTARYEITKYNGIDLPSWVKWPFSSLFPNRALKPVSDVIIPLPFGGKGGTIRQVTVRIRSTQEYQLSAGDKFETTSLTEHVVIQKMLFEGLEDKWMIWGTVLPSTKEEIDRYYETLAGSTDGGVRTALGSMLPSWAPGASTF